MNTQTTVEELGALHTSWNAAKAPALMTVDTPPNFVLGLINAVAQESLESERCRAIDGMYLNPFLAEHPVIGPALNQGMNDQLSAFRAATRTLKDVKFQIDAALAESVKRALAKEAVGSDAPAVIVRKSLGDAINSGDLRPGQKLQGSELIFITAWEPTHPNGDRLGRLLVSFGAPENVPREPRSFYLNVLATWNLENWHGYSGWKFDPPERCGTSSREEARFRSYQDGSGIGVWAVPESRLLNGFDREGNLVTRTNNMLVLSRYENSAFHSTFSALIRSESAFAKRLQSCTVFGGSNGRALSVCFPGGETVFDGLDDGRSCVRPVVALELSHLIL